MNHHLLAADITVRRAQGNWQDAAVLPPYRRLVIDEAHHLEDTAAQHLGARASSRGLTRLLSRLERNGRGLIPTLLNELGSRTDRTSHASAQLLRTELLRSVDEARGYSASVFGFLCERLQKERGDVFRLDDTFQEDPIWDHGLGVGLDNLVAIMRRLKDGVETVADRMELDLEPDRRSQLVQELRGVIRRLQAVADGMLLALRPQPGSGMVRWMERSGTRPAGGLPFPVGLAAVPLDLAQVLKETLFDRVETVILTSATLATGGEFEFLKDRLGLDLEPHVVKYEDVLPSPFDFGAQCLFGVPTDLPDPRGDEAGHDRALANAVLDLANAADGGMFVLFTSYAALRRVAAQVRGRIGGRWPFLVQGEGPRDQLLRRFRDAGSAVLFGTDSFW